jgi:hypothetical protein
MRHVLTFLDHPLRVLGVTLPVFWIAARLGDWLRTRQRDHEREGEEDLRFVLGGALTLLGLIIGFTFAMAISRYEQRKNYEEQEANAIGTEYVRADLLPAEEASRVRALMREYLDQRILFYTAREGSRLGQIDARTAELQAEMWSAVAAHASSNPTPVAALVAAGMNDVLNTQGYTQAAWWNRIPLGAWGLLISMSTFCNLLVGIGTQGRKTSSLLILPVVLSITLFFIADMESPRGGVILVQPQNLQAVAESVRPR